MVNSNSDSHGSMSDEVLMRRFKGGDETAFNEIVNRYKSEVLNYLFKLTGDYHEADDIAQESFVRLFKYKDNYDESFKFSQWFYSIVINRAKTSANKNLKSKIVSIDDIDDSEIKNNGLYSNPEDKEDEEDENYLNGVRVESIKKAFDKLDYIYKEAVLLRYHSDLDYESISRILGIPAGTVKSRISRGKKQLKEIIKSEYHAG